MSVSVGANEKKPVSLTLAATAAPGMPGAGLGTGTDPGANGGTGGGVKPKTIALIAGGALTAISLGVGIGFMLDANSSEDEADDLREQAVAEVGPGGCATSSAAVCNELADANDQAESSRSLSTVGFIGAGVAAAATVAIFFLWPDEERAAGRARSVAVSPAVTPGSAGLSIHGRF